MLHTNCKILDDVYLRNLRRTICTMYYVGNQVGIVIKVRKFTPN